MFATLVIIAIVAGFCILAFVLKKSGLPGGLGGSVWVQFYAAGKDSGFSLRDIELLRKLAVKCKLESPSTLFWSQKQLDICIRSVVQSRDFSASNKEEESFLARLYKYRKKLEMETPRLKNGISNSRQISDGQTLRIFKQGAGVFKSEVIKKNQTHLTVVRPSNDKITDVISWEGAKISVYFWREDDAGYVFDSVVEGEVFSHGIPSIQIAHSNSLFRTQKRKSIRVKLHKPAFLYALNDQESSNTIETEPGVKCFLKDLSDTGCSITIGGRGQSDMRLKVQFTLGNTPISMSGTVRSVGYLEQTNRSTLRIEADPLPIEIRNKIQGEVFGLLPDEEKEQPFREMQEAADRITAAFLAPDPPAPIDSDSSYSNSADNSTISTNTDDTLNPFT